MVTGWDAAIGLSVVSVLAALRLLLPSIEAAYNPPDD